MPAPSRYVVDLPGSPGVDAIDATVFGPWTQPADQTADLVALTGSPEDPVTGGVAIDATQIVKDPEDIGPEEPVDETSGLAASLTASSDFGAPAGAGGSLAVQHSSWAEYGGGVPGDPDDDPVQFIHRLSGWRSAGGTTLACSAQDLYWHDEWITGEAPEGAIGYEVEQVELPPEMWVPVAEPLSLHIVLTFEPTVYFGTAAGDAVAVLNHQWGDGPVEFSFAGPLLDMMVTRTAPSTLAAADDDSIDGPITIPLTGYPLPHVVEGDVDISLSPPYTGLLGLHQTVKTSGEVAVTEGETLEARSNVSASGVYTIRPPRFRWIYATDPTQPYRRTYPRSDGLAGGAAPRTWPRPRSVQASNRTSGSTYL